MKFVLDHEGPFRPGDDISGHVDVRRGDLTALTVELGWELEGEGDPNRDVERTAEIDPGGLEGGGRFPFRLDCPRELYTHRGDLLRLDWFLRARAAVRDGGEVETRQEVVVLPPGRDRPARPPRGRRETHDGTLEDLVLERGGGVFGGLRSLIAATLGRGVELAGVELELSSRQVRPGDTLEWRVAFEAPGGADIERVGVRIWGREEAALGEGRRAVTLTSTVVDETLPLTGALTLADGERFERRGGWAVPEDAPLSFTVDNGGFEWSAEALIEAGGRTIRREWQWFRVGVESDD